MKATDNKIFVALATTNIFAFIMIFVLVWLLWESNKTTQEIPAVQAEKTLILDNIEPTQIKVQAQKTLRELAVSEQTASVQAQQNRDENKSFLKQKTVSTSERLMQEVNAAGADMAAFNVTPTQKTQAVDERDDAGVSDQAYILASNQLDTQKPVERQYTKEQVSTVQAMASLTGDSSENASAKNRFNKVDVSRHQSKNALTQKLAVIVSNTESVAKGDSGTLKPLVWQDYLHSLKPEEAERKNEMRTIKVKQGDTLWQLATRAYGSGFLYTKIFEANPHLVNPESITAGEILRVPL